MQNFVTWSWTMLLTLMILTSWQTIPPLQWLLHEAVKSGLITVVKRIIERVDDRFPLDGSGHCPLFHAVSGGHLKVFQLLLSYSKESNPIINSHNNISILHIAVMKGKNEICKFLISTLPQSHKNPFARYVGTPLSLALERNNFDLVDFIKSQIQISLSDETPTQICYL